MSSCSSAFVKMEACHLELVGVAGSLIIHGQGTAMFLASDGEGHEVVFRIHNCLFSFGEFNLLSVSQFQLGEGNSVDFSVAFKWAPRQSGWSL